jgi:hemolysin activation/secretion protein
VVLLAGLQAAGAGAQESPGFPDFPGNRPLPLPQPTPGPEPESLRAPEFLRRPPEPAGIPIRVQVRAIVVERNTVLPSERVDEVTSGYLGRPLQNEDLQALTDRLTQLLASAGYVNSWAVLPDQDFEAGVLRVRLVEGRLADVVVTGNRGYRTSYLRDRLLGSADQPLNAFALERRIRALQLEPAIRSLQATLRPGVSRDRAVLYVEVLESPRVSASLDFGDLFNPLIGEMGGHLGVAVLNPLAGRGDRFGAMAGLSAGLSDIQFDYRIPVGRRRTELSSDFRYSEAAIVDASLEELDIRSRYMAVGVTVSQPLWQADGFQIEAGVRAEWRESRSTVSGFPFNFTEAVDSEGNSRDFVLRFFQNLVFQTGRQAFAFRSTWSVGLDALGATSSSVDTAEFAAWLGQVQWLRRMEASGVEFLLRGNVQIALDPLLPFERFSVGGRSSVRGYRENQEVRDNGYSLGLEARIPILRSPAGRTLLRVGPFIDMGRSWTEPRDEETSHADLASLGVEAVWSPSPKLRFEFIYGIRLIPVDERGETSLQDYGIEFRVVAATF